MKKLNDKGIAHLLVIIVASLVLVSVASYFVWNRQRGTTAKAMNYTTINSSFSKATAVNFNEIIVSGKAWLPTMKACKQYMDLGTYGKFYKIMASVDTSNLPAKYKDFVKAAVLRVDQKGLSTDNIRKVFTEKSVDLEIYAWGDPNINIRDTFKVQLSLTGKTYNLAGALIDSSGFFTTPPTQISSMQTCS